MDEFDKAFSKSFDDHTSDDPNIGEDHPLLLPLDQPVVTGEMEYRVYRRRWYVLTLFVLLATSQLCFWNTWGPIADTGNYWVS